MARKISKAAVFPRKLTAFDSSNISEITWSPDSKLMKVYFESGAVYLYENVTAEDFGKIASADSIGKTFNTLKEKWPYERIMDQ